MLDQEGLQDFLEAYGRELVGGDLDGIAARHSYPAYVAGDTQSIPVASPADVKGAFTGAAERYREHGVVGAVPEIRRMEELTSRLVWADVRWSYLDGTGAELRAESYRYLLREAGNSCMICVVVALGAE
ncbi:hypothetical protein GCM10007079_33970 [Nocardiopsis terrae]|uniref:SnoaL-like domain-containing protein n=1 Tax=Nocardiopsis terrae TaxID=372655 RepID=A0ABR9HJM4_9ACTN|nr:hypothetical protein [Nocardiopsis terrae]MBE1459209.1 hypothetical protein [Nocardiopsis terrae]GHC88763.1 hypothetical protein GCM10007079_33970 [Nocardiopsis terrae]